MTKIDPFGVEKLPRRVMPLFFVVDTSGSMDGNKIASLNTAVREVLPDLDEISKNNSDALIKVAALEFSSDARWMYDGLQEASAFQWQDMKASGMTSFGASCTELNKKLSQSKGWMAEPTGMRAPAIILLSDGGPTDAWEHPLETLKQNKWFKTACKIAIAIGDDADKDVLAEFTGSREAVITVHNTDQLKKLIKTVSVTASMVSSDTSKANASGNGSNGATPLPDPTQKVIGAITNDVGSDPSLAGVDFGDSSDNAGSDDWGW